MQSGVCMLLLWIQNKFYECFSFLTNPKTSCVSMSIAFTKLTFSVGWWQENNRELVSLWEIIDDRKIGVRGWDVGMLWELAWYEEELDSMSRMAVLNSFMLLAHSFLAWFPIRRSLGYLWLSIFICSLPHWNILVACGRNQVLFCSPMNWHLHFSFPTSPGGHSCSASH